MGNQLIYKKLKILLKLKFIDYIAKGDINEKYS